MVKTNQHPDAKKRRKAKITVAIVQYIRQAKETRKELAEFFGVGEYTIRDIRQYRTWAWVD